MYFQVFYSMGFCSCTSKYFYSMGILLMYFQVFLFYGNFTHVLPSIFILWDFLLMYFQVFVFYGNFTHVLPSIFILWEFYSCTSKYFYSMGFCSCTSKYFFFLTGCICLLNVCKIFLTLAKSLLLWRKARRACSDINSFCSSV